MEKENKEFNVEAWAAEILNSDGFRRWDLAQIPGEIDMSGPDDE